MNLTAFPPTFAPAPQPQVTSITGAPLLQADHSGDAVYLAFGSAPGGPVAEWSASAPNSFTVSTAKDFSTDLTAASDGTMFAIRSGRTTEIRGANLTLAALPTSAVTVLQLSSVPLGIGTVAPAVGPSAGGTNLTIRGSGFQSGTKATLGAKALSVVFKDKNTLTCTTPALPSGAQQLVLTNPDAERVLLDAAFAAQ